MTDPFTALYDFGYRWGYRFGLWLAGLLTSPEFWGQTTGLGIVLVLFHLLGVIQVCWWGGCR